MERREPQNIRQIVDAVVDRWAGRDAFQEHRAASMWRDIVGSDIGRQTTRTYCRDGVLHVYLSSAPLKQELSFMRPSLVAKINAALGQDIVNKIVFH